MHQHLSKGGGFERREEGAGGIATLFSVLAVLFSSYIFILFLIGKEPKMFLWFDSGWRDLSTDPRAAGEGMLCKSPQRFATQGELLVDPTTLLSEGRWQHSPPYVHYTASMKRHRLHALSCFRLSAHFLKVKTVDWARPRPSRAERVFGLCSSGVAGELHMLHECPGHSVMREGHTDML
jgi:hypothetical protein